MTPTEATKLLELPADATPDQVEARFLELRRRLEDKIAKAPTPGLQAKYRETLTEITTAFETLALAADSSALPVLAREQETGSKEKGRGADDRGRKTEGGGSGPAPSSLHPSPAPRRKSGSEFVVVALVAVLVLGAGGWFIMKTRAESAEKARLAAEAQAEAERVAEEKRLAAEAEARRIAEERRLAEEEKVRQAAAEKAEQERRDTAIALLRSRMAQLNVQADSFFREEPARAARRLSELKADERALSRDQNAGNIARLRAQLDAQQDYVDQLDTTLLRHPARVTQAQATELIAAKELEPAEAAVAQLEVQLQALDGFIGEARRRLDTAIYGTLQVTNEFAQVRWVFTDAFGAKFSGGASQTLPEVGVGGGTIEFTQPGWPVSRQAVVIRSAATTRVAADFRPARLLLDSQPTGMPFRLSTGQTGRTPAEVELVPGRVDLVLGDSRHVPYKETLTLGLGEQRTLNPALRAAGPLWSSQEVSAFANGYTTGIGMYPYSGTVLSLAPDDSISAAVVSALPISVAASPFPAPPASALRGPGTGLSLTYYGQMREGQWTSTGATISHGFAQPVSFALREDCDGLVLLVGLATSKGAWQLPPMVYGATHPDLVPLAQAWAQGFRIQLARPAPNRGMTYRVAIAVKFRRTE